MSTRYAPDSGAQPLDGQSGRLARRRRITEPRRVHARVVEHERSDPLPRAIDVVRDEDRRRGAGRRNDAHPCFPSEARALVAVGVLEAWRPRLREERETESGGPASGGGSAAAVHQQWTAGRRRQRRHAYRASVVCELLAGPRALQHGQALLHTPTSVRQCSPEHRVLLGAIAEARDVGHSAAAHHVEHGHVLGKAHRIMQRNEERGDGDGDCRGASRDRGGQQQRRRQVSVGRCVMLREHDRQCAVFLSPNRHLDRGLVELSDAGRAVGRGAHVEPQHEHGGHRTSAPRSRGAASPSPTAPTVCETLERANGKAWVASRNPRLPCRNSGR